MFFTINKNKQKWKIAIFQYFFQKKNKENINFNILNQKIHKNLKKNNIKSLKTPSLTPSSSPYLTATFSSANPLGSPQLL